MKFLFRGCLPIILVTVVSLLHGCQFSHDDRQFLDADVIDIGQDGDSTCNDDALPNPDDVCGRDFLDASVPCDPQTPVTLECRDFGHFFGRLRCNPDSGELCGSCRSTEVIGTCSVEYPTGLAIDGEGNLYLAGYTYGPLDGFVNYGNWTIFLMRISADGQRLWTRRWGELYPDDDPYKTGMSMATDVITDRWGNVYVTGFRRGGNYPFYDEVNFLARFDGDGQLIWTREWTKEPEGDGEMEGPRSLAVDSEDNIIVCGDENGPLPDQSHQGENDLYLLKYSPDGDLLWVKQWGTPQSDYCSDLVLTSEDGILVVGNTEGDLTGSGNTSVGNAFLSLIDPGGDVAWVRQWVTDYNNNAYGVALDRSGSIIVAGNTWYRDAVTNRNVNLATLHVFDMEGNLLSSEVPEPSQEDQSIFMGIGVDPVGHIVVYGMIYGPPDELTGDFNLDIFLSWYAPDLTKQGTIYKGSESDERPAALAFDSSGNIFLTGETQGPLGGYHIGSRDIFLLFLPKLPE